MCIGFYPDVARSNLPGGLHELHEVVVVVNGRGDGGVVVVPLGLGNNAVIVFISEVGEELEEGLVLSDFP